MTIEQEYDAQAKRDEDLRHAIETLLNDRERSVLRHAMLELARSYHRKRSWRGSEVAAAQADVEGLSRRLGLGSIFKSKN